VELLKKDFGMKAEFYPESVMRSAERDRLARLVAGAKAGSVHVLENVRFELGEEENDVELSQAYASLGDLFVNDAFASCHRTHASVVGIAKCLPAYAGPNLVDEATALSRLLTKPKRPFVAVIGGLKISTKLPVIKILLSVCDHLLIGGAMATTIEASLKQQVGVSIIEEDEMDAAKMIGKNKKVLLPIDAVVTNKTADPSKAETVSIHKIPKLGMIVDIGPETLDQWSSILAKANTILWNGPVGMVEKPEFAKGSLHLARIIGQRVKGRPFGVVGGGDTDPLVLISHTKNMFDHISMGGGALLDFIAEKGKMPGLLPLVTK
jgi:phosphoglycerate kinase